MLREICKNCIYCEGIGDGERHCLYYNSRICYVADWEWDSDENYCDKFTDKKEVNNLRELWMEED